MHMGTSGDSETRLAVRQLEGIAEGFIRNSLAPSTQRAYNTVQTRYLRFCEAIHRPPIPASEQALILFVAFLAQTVCHGTIRAYLSGVRHLHISQGYTDPLTGTLQLDLVLRGIKRSKTSSTDRRLPIIPLILQSILGVIKRDPASFTNIMMWAACWYFAFLRCGEFTVNGSFDPDHHITLQEISRQLPKSFTTQHLFAKTDQDSVGITLYVGKTSNEICPVTAILSYLVARSHKNQSGPLFIQEDGHPLPRESLVTWLRSNLVSAGINATHFSGHSFRIGAASVAAARGVADSIIQSLGRWKSDSFKRNIRIPREELAQISSTIAT